MRSRKKLRRYNAFLKGVIMRDKGVIMLCNKEVLHLLYIKWSNNVLQKCIITPLKMTQSEKRYITPSKRRLFDLYKNYIYQAQTYM